MMFILDLLNKIKWDKRENKNDYKLCWHVNYPSIALPGCARWLPDAR